MSLKDNRLYELLPAIYRIRDSEQGEPLKALFDVITREAGIVEADINQMYENWFIETCNEWVVPYIGDLFGVRGMHSINEAAIYSKRAYVANTLSYRRRKGTATVLEQLALDITGWRARVVEFFELLGTNQNLNHIRLSNLITPDLRSMNKLDLLDTGFDSIAHTVDVRRICTGLGRNNIPNIGLFLWRLTSYPIARSTSCKPDSAPKGCYTFSSLGNDSHLFNQPQTETEIIHIAEEINIPGLLRRWVLHDELRARRNALADGKTPIYGYFGPDDTDERTYPAVFKIYLNNNKLPVKASKITICNLKNWRLPNPPFSVAVDPVLGRLTVAKPDEINQVQVNYAFGFSGDVGGGPYDRQESVSSSLARDITWHVGVSKKKTSIADETIFDNLTDAIAQWNIQPDGSVGIITIMDNHTYKEDLSGINKIKIPGGSQLLIVAADWPDVDVPGGSLGVRKRVKGSLNANELRPHLLGNMEVEGTNGSPPSDTGGELVLNGLLIEGKLTVVDGNLGSLQVLHSTLVPDKNGLEINKNDLLKIKLQRSICGPIRVKSESAKLLINECIVDNRGGVAISSDLTSVEIQRSTILGSTEAMKIETGNSIFTGIVDIERKQVGCIRFSYVPNKSETPIRFRCQPDLEIKTRISEAEKQGSISQIKKNKIRKQILGWLTPGFTSTEFGHFAYAQLSRACPLQIKTGGDDGAEMGVFNFLKQPQRDTNLRIALEEYLYLGLEAGIIYVT